MREVTKKTVSAFLAGTARKVGNTESTGTALKLHGNTIAERLPDGSVYATLAGWGSRTTRDRLNGLVALLGLKGRFRQEGFVQYFRDMPIGTYESVVLVRPEGKPVSV